MYVHIIFSVPDTPKALTLLSQSNEIIKISWDEVSGATFYNIRYRVSETGTFTRIRREVTMDSDGNFRLSTNDTEVTLSDLNESTVYDVFVRAANLNGQSAESNGTFITSESM